MTSLTFGITRKEPIMEIHTTRYAEAKAETDR
jgi:hypothetical protein